MASTTRSIAGAFRTTTDLFDTGLLRNLTMGVARTPSLSREHQTRSPGSNQRVFGPNAMRQYANGHLIGGRTA